MKADVEPSVFGRGFTDLAPHGMLEVGGSAGRQAFRGSGLDCAKDYTRLTLLILALRP
jgi:hypothetical protein